MYLWYSILLIFVGHFGPFLESFLVQIFWRANRKFLFSLAAAKNVRAGENCPYMQECESIPPWYNLMRQGLVGRLYSLSACLAF